jgi:hypothetical protein
MAKLAVVSFRAIPFHEKFANPSSITRNQLSVIFISLHKARLEGKVVTFISKINSTFDIGIDDLHGDAAKT